MLKLKLQYFDHLMQRANWLEKTLMLGKIEGRKKRGQQRMRWLDGSTDSMDVSLSKLRVMVKPGVLQSMGSPRDEHDLATEQQQQTVVKIQNNNYKLWLELEVNSHAWTCWELMEEVSLPPCRRPGEKAPSMNQDPESAGTWILDPQLPEPQERKVCRWDTPALPQPQHFVTAAVMYWDTTGAHHHPRCLPCPLVWWTWPRERTAHWLYLFLFSLHPTPPNPIKWQFLWFYPLSCLSLPWLLLTQWLTFFGVSFAVSWWSILQPPLSCLPLVSNFCRASAQLPGLPSNADVSVSLSTVETLSWHAYQPLVLTSGSVTAPGTRRHTSSLSLGMSPLRTAEGVLSGLRGSRWGHGRAPVSLGQRQRVLGLLCMWLVGRSTALTPLRSGLEWGVKEVLETMTGRPEDPHKGSSRQTVMLNLGLGRQGGRKGHVQTPSPKWGREEERACHSSLKQVKGGF